MPIPKPRKDEKESDYIGRCMSDKVMKREYPDQKQRSAVCYQTWRDSKKKKAGLVLDAIGADPWLITPETLELIVHIATRSNTDTEALSFKDDKRMSKESGSRLKKRGNVAILEIKGPIFRYANLFTEVSGATSLERLAKDFNTALESDEYDSIILDIDSPGGQVNGINEFADAVYEARKKKPVKAYIGGSGTSAAYWIASAASEVVVDETAMLGSIGVVLSVRRKKDSDVVELINSTSPRKRADVDTDEGKQQVVKLLDAIASVFVEKVARNRGVPADDVLGKFGQGDILVGKAAVDVGMADRLGSFESLLSDATDAEEFDGGTNMSEKMTRAQLEKLYPDIIAEIVSERESKDREAREALAREVEKLRRASTLARLEKHVGEELAGKLIGLGDKLTDDELMGVAAIIASLQATIRDLGKARGEIVSTKDVISEASISREVEDLAKAEGIPVSEAWVEYAKKHPDRIARME